MAYMEKDVSDLLSAMDASFDEESGDWRECDELAFQQLADECVRPKLERMQKARVALAGDIAAVDAEIKRLQERKKSLQRNDDRLANRILFGLNAVYDGKLKTPLFTFSRRLSERLIVDDEKAVPPEFLKTKIEVDKAGLKKHIKETGEIFNGVHFEETESLSVR